MNRTGFPRRASSAPCSTSWTRRALATSPPARWQSPCETSMTSWDCSAPRTHTGTPWSSTAGSTTEVTAGNYIGISKESSARLEIARQGAFRDVNRFRNAADLQGVREGVHPFTAGRSSLGASLRGMQLLRPLQPLHLSRPQLLLRPPRFLQQWSTDRRGNRWPQVRHMPLSSAKSFIFKFFLSPSD